MSYKVPQNFFSIAGKHELTGDIIIKAVNASANPNQTSISLTSVAGLQPMGELISLRSASPDTENNCSAPTKYIPQTQTVGGIKSSFEINLKPYSNNELRLHTK